MLNKLFSAVLLHVTLVAAQLDVTDSSCFKCATGNKFQCVGDEGGDNNPWEVKCCNSATQAGCKEEGKIKCSGPFTKDKAAFYSFCPM